MSSLAIVQIGCLGTFSLLLVIAAGQDLRSLHIGDAIPLAITATFLPWALAGWALGAVSPLELGVCLAGAIALFGLGALAFAAQALGGGDVKLLAAASLFAGPTSLLLDYLLVTALAGGLMALAALAGRQIGPRRAAGCLAPGGRGVRLPYGPAIAAGGLWVAATRVLG